MKPALLYRTSSYRCTTGVLTALSLLAATQTQAQDASVMEEELQEIVVSASRAPQEWRQTSSSVSVLSLEEMAVMQVADLKSSLAQESGVSVIATGAVGADTSIYIRGAYPHHTLLVVDGVRMNDRSASYGAFMGGSGMQGVDRIEVLRGAQSTLYGSAAMGGVIVMNTAKGTSALQGGVELSGGSFDTHVVSGALTGSAGPFGFSVSAGLYETANERDFNEYDNTSYSARLSYDVTDSLEIGLTYRKQDATFQTPGSLVYYSPGTAETGNELATAYLEWYMTDTITTKFVFGYHEREYDWIDDWGVSSQLNERKIYEWQTAWAPTSGLSIVVGANYEESEYQINDNLSGDKILAGFVSGTFDVTDTVTLTAGVRYDDFETVGSATTWRTGLAWMATPDTKVRATYGTGFSAPGSSDRYGVPAWSQLPNPDLRPEESTGWDIGVDRSFLGGTVAVSLTYFENEFNDLIDWVYTDYATYTGMYQNRSSAETSGVELGLTAQPLDAWHVRFGYTYMEGKDGDTGERLTRRPRNSIDASTWVNVTDNFTCGFGVRGMYDRTDSAGPMDDYTIVRAFASYQLGNLAIKARVENLLDKEYQEVYGYPALTRGYYGSVEWRF
jgi:Outer membrane cobalamin receptor protein